MKADVRGLPALPRRRRMLAAGATTVGLAAMGLPALLHAQQDKVRIGHLTPLTGSSARSANTP
jgi:branched-chain amino acid transport system substrate-binding protein